MTLTQHFTLEELIHSDTAVKKKISNIPDEEQNKHLLELAKLLESLRLKYARPIKINSGFRSAALNKAVGGTPTSSHCYGYAADCVPANGEMIYFQRAVIEWSKNAIFDQIIFEKTNTAGVAQWIHIGVRRGTNNTQRKQLLYTPNGKNYYTCNPSTPCMRV